MLRPLLQQLPEPLPQHLQWGPDQQRLLSRRRMHAEQLRVQHLSGRLRQRAVLQPQRHDVPRVRSPVGAGRQRVQHGLEQELPQLVHGAKLLRFAAGERAPSLRPKQRLVCVRQLGQDRAFESPDERVCCALLEGGRRLGGFVVGPGRCLGILQVRKGLAVVGEARPVRLLLLLQWSRGVAAA